MSDLVNELPKIQTDSLYPPRADIFANQYSFELTEKYGELSTKETEKKIKTIIGKYWESSSSKPILPSQPTLQDLSEVALFIEDNFPFTFEGERSYGVATISRQTDLLSSILEEKIEIEQKHERRVTPLLKINKKLEDEDNPIPEQEKEALLTKRKQLAEPYLVAVDKMSDFRHKYSSQFDCKLPAMMFGYLLDYLKDKNGYQYETYLYHQPGSPHPRVVLRIPGVTSTDKKPIADTYWMVHFVGNQNNMAIKTKLKPEVWKEAPAEGFLPLEWKSLQKMDTLFVQAKERYE